MNLGSRKCWRNVREFFHVFYFLTMLSLSQLQRFQNYSIIQWNSLYRAVRFAKFEGIWGFSVPSILLADLLGNTCLLARAQKVLVCDSWLVAFDPFCLFRVSRALLCDRPVSGNNRLVKFASQIFWSFLFLSLARIKQRLPPSFDKNSAHHSDLPSLFLGSL